MPAELFGGAASLHTSKHAFGCFCASIAATPVIAQQFELVGCDLAAESSKKSVLAIDFVIEHTKILTFNSARPTEHVRTQFK